MASFLPQVAWSIITIVCTVTAIICLAAADECHWSDRDRKRYTYAAIITAIISVISFINIWYAPNLANFRQNVHLDIRDSQIQTALKEYMSKLTPEQRYDLMTK